MSAPEGLVAALGALGHDSWRVRKEAVGTIAGWPRPEEALPELCSLLDADASVAARSSAVEALAALGRAAVPALVGVLSAPGSGRKLAIDALAAMGPRAARAAAAALIDRVDDAAEDDNVRAAAAETLGGLALDGEQAAAAARALRHALGGGPLQLRAAVLDAVVRLAADVPLAELLRLLDEPVLRPAALEAAAGTGDLEALPHLLHALADRGRGARAAATRALVVLHARQQAPDARARVEASVRASQAGAVRMLVAAIEEGAPPLRRAAATLAGWGRFAEALPALCAELVDDEVHDAAAHAVAAYGPFAVGPLCELCSSAPAPVRRELYLVFPRLGAAAADARVAQACLRGLHDDDEGAAAAAARALGEIGGKDALGPLLHALEERTAAAEEGGADVVLAMGQALVRLCARYPADGRVLVSARGLDGTAAPHLCRALGAVGDAGERPRVLTALRAADPALRRAAADALGALGRSADSIEGLVFALADDDAGVRAAGAAALGQLGAGESAVALAAACRDDDPAVAAAAIRALSGVLRHGEAAPAAPALRAHALADRGAVTVAAVEALAGMGDPADDALLLELLARRDPEVVKAAAEALASRPRPAARAGLLALLAHDRWDVRRAAAVALRAHGGGADLDDAVAARAAVEDDALVTEALAELRRR